MNKMLAACVCVTLWFTAAVCFAAAYPKLSLDLATVYDAKSPPALGGAKFKELVEQKSKGAITINLFTNGSLGTEKDNFTMLAADEFPFVIGGIQPIDMYAPAYMFLSAPYVVVSWDHLKNILNSDIGKNLAASLEKNNIRSLAVNYRGIRNTTSNKPIKNPADMKGVKLRLSEITSWVAFWQGIGALTTPVALPELYGALQTNVVEASEGPYEQFATNKLYEVQKYIVNTRHIYEPTWLYISDKLYKAQNAETRLLFDEAAQEAMAYANAQAEGLSNKFLKEMTDHGVQVIEPDMQAFQTAADPVLAAMFKSIWTVTTPEAVKSYR